MNKWDKIKKTDLKSLGEAPTEISENIKAPELAPKDNRFTGRTKRIAFTCRPEFAEELRRLAYEENCYQIEVLEKALEVYKQERKSPKPTRKISTQVKVIEHKPKKLTSYSYINFTCDKCGDEYEQDVAYSYAPSLKELNRYQTYCGGCVK